MRTPREVILIASSSRGGSSVFSEFLRRSRALLHLQGEINPFLHGAGLTFPHTGTGSDRLDADHARVPGLGALWAALATDVGNPTDRIDTPERRDRFLAALHARLRLQWPHLTVSAAQVEGAAQQALRRLGDEAGWAPGRVPEVQTFHAAFLHALRAEHAAINPHYYDLSRAVIGRWCPAARPDGPPGPLVIEEPPFVTVSPWEPAAPDDPRPLMIKTPSNAYRLDFFRALWPSARLRVLHLTRNAAASINGLYDGWRYPEGFHAHRLDVPLEIAGYSERRPWGRWWWQYDLPPGWTDWTRAPLEGVCGFQWRSAHQHTLAWLAAHPEVEHLQVRFEDLVASTESARRTVDRVVGWLGIAADAALHNSTVLAMPPVMSTDQPRQRRWFEKAALLEPVLKRPDTRSLMEHLGYDPDPETWL